MAIGTGVILVCVLVSVVTGGAGAAAVSLVFATAAKTGTAAALTGGVIGGTTAGIIKSQETDDTEEIIKAIALEGSKGYKIGAICGTVSGGMSESFLINGLVKETLFDANQVARLLKLGYSRELILALNECSLTTEQIALLENYDLFEIIVDGKHMLVQNIDLDIVDEFGRTNAQRMTEGLAALDENGKAFQLHHLGQKDDSLLVVLSQEQHTGSGVNTIWHPKGAETDNPSSNPIWNSIRKKIWKAVADNPALK